MPVDSADDYLCRCRGKRQKINREENQDRKCISFSELCCLSGESRSNLIEKFQSVQRARHVAIALES